MGKKPAPYEREDQKFSKAEKIGYGILGVVALLAAIIVVIFVVK